jgi:hypothetical protein
LPSLEKANVQEFHGLEVLCKPKDDGDSVNVVERPQLTASTPEEGPPDGG